MDVVALAEQQITRLAGVGRVLAVRRQHPPFDQPKLLVQWTRSVPMLLGLWSRLAPGIEDDGLGLGFDDASAAEVRRGKVLDHRAYAEETVTLVRDLRDEVAVSLGGTVKATRNRVLFYFNREIDDLLRIYKL